MCHDPCMTTIATKFVSIHPAQTADHAAEYDPKLSVPYPYHIDQEGIVGRQDHWCGKPYRLLGFTDDADVFEVPLSRGDWLAGDVQVAVGMFAVFGDKDGGMWTCANPIERITRQ